ncbi:hypothetical protein LDENG_00043600 [Lucifuga dentata]|nr:hypothetical protein LDENG_00043600 [Lucifuga dentata]
MINDDFQFMEILKGKRIKLTLTSSTYFGVVQRINLNKTVVLGEVVGGSNGCKIPGSKLFFGHEIVNVEFIGEVNGRKINEHKAENHLTIERFQPYKKTITLDEDEYGEHINFVVIDEFHEKFGPAVMHIKKQHVIGVGADGVAVFQHGRLCWLQIATKNKVYLFDILLLGARAFKNGLSMILENKNTLKVIYDCRAVSGCLVAQFGVKLANVFDIQVADVMCFYSETGGFLPDRVSTLQEVVSHHLKVPSTQLLSLEMKSQLTEEEGQMWYKRPCPVPLLKAMALSVIHLQPLRLVLLDSLMADYMALVDSYLSSSHYQPDELQHINMESVLDLPRELRELERMHQERREWAAEHYPLTEQGLLARFKPRVPPSTQNSPTAEELSSTQLDSPEPATVESPPSAKVDLFLHQPSTDSPLVTSISSAQSVAVCPTPAPVAQAPLTSAASDLRKQMCLSSPQSVAVGQGLTERVTGTVGRGRPFGKDQQSFFPAFTTAGRGLLLQIPPAQVPRENPGDVKSPERM